MTLFHLNEMMCFDRIVKKKSNRLDDLSSGYYSFSSSIKPEKVAWMTSFSRYLMLHISIKFDKTCT